MKMKPFQMPQSVKIETKEGDTYAKFVIGPFERGFGTTMGNVFRRILLSSIHGASITKVRFDKAHHEFQTIDGVVENVTDIILNLKKLRFKMEDTDEPRSISINVKGPKEVTAADIDMPTGIEIVNKDLFLFNITQKTNVKIEIVVEWGRGYLPYQYIEPDKTIGTIEIDAFFSPIKRVVTNVETMRVGQRTDYDKLILEIYTDSTILPEDALKEAAVILKGHIDVFDIKDRKLPILTEEAEDEDILQMREKLNKKVTDLELSIRAKNCLDANKIETLADLVSKTKDEMLKYKNFGRQSLNQLEDKLKQQGLHFGMEVSKYLKSDNE